VIEVTDEMVATFDQGVDRETGYLSRPQAEVVRAGVSAVLALFVQNVEGQRGSGICDCDCSDSEPTSPRDGSAMDHHCDCRAVITAAMLLGAYSETVHARQCGHGTSMDEFYQRRKPGSVQPT
jgi:hypothetical protein